MKNFRELLIVCGTSAILLLLTIAAADTASAKSAICQNNLKSLYAIFQQYQNDHGVLPPVIVQQKPRWQFWSNYISPYVTDEKIQACPEDPRNASMFESRRSPLLPAPKRAADSYGMNYFLTAHFAGQKGKTANLNNLSNTAKTILLGDCKGPYMLPERYWKEERAMRHADETANYVFADGHIEQLGQFDLGAIGRDGIFRTDFSHWHWL